jgi:hypothetical protein
MIIIPMIGVKGRQHITDIVRLLTAIPRALAYLIGGVLGAIVAGFLMGWRDSP